jgi:hypothetical protein
MHSQRIRFVRWTAEGADAEIARHDIALVPQQSPYKSNNRAITAYALGVAVAWQPSQVVDLLDADDRLRTVMLGRQLVEREYDVRQSVETWRELLTRYLARREASKRDFAYVQNPKGESA